MRECPDCGLAYSGDVEYHVCPDVDDFADEDDDIAEDTGGGRVERPRRWASVRNRGRQHDVDIVVDNAIELEKATKQVTA